LRSLWSIGRHHLFDLCAQNQSGATDGGETHFEHRGIYFRPPEAASSYRCLWRAVYRWGGIGASVSEPAGANGGKVHSTSAQRQTGGASLRNRRPSALPN